MAPKCPRSLRVGTYLCVELIRVAVGIGILYVLDSPSICPCQPRLLQRVEFCLMEDGSWESEELPIEPEWFGLETMLMGCFILRLILGVLDLWKALKKFNSSKYWDQLNQPEGGRAGWNWLVQISWDVYHTLCTVTLLLLIITTGAGDLDKQKYVNCGTETMAVIEIILRLAGFMLIQRLEKETEVTRPQNLNRINKKRI